MADTHLHALPSGYEFEGYRIERVLGAGGFGITYKAQETLIRRAVAIKEYMPNSVAGRSTAGHDVRPLNADDDEIYRWGLKRFRNEARTLVAFHHPNIVAVYRYFEANGTAYLVMAYEEGMTLAAVLKQAKTLEESEIHDFLDPLLNGVEEVHKAGFLHRDIKPANIVLRRDGAPVLIDFGAARLALGTKSQGSRAVLSPGYAPFEQYATVAEQGPFTDIYALGATLYACISGQRPVEAPDRVAGVVMKSAAEIGHGHYTPGFLAAIDRALAVKAEDRPKNVTEWRKELSGETPPVRVASSPAPVTEPDGTMMLAAAAPTSRLAVVTDSTPTAPPPVHATTLAQSAPTRRGRMVRIAIITAAALLLAAGAYAGIDYYRAAERDRMAAAVEKARQEEQTRQAEREAERAKVESERQQAQKRERAEAAAQKARDAQRAALAIKGQADAVRQQARSAAECGRQAATRARSNQYGYGTGQFDGGQYAGQVSNNRMHGCGVYSWTDGRRWEGMFRDGQMVGLGVFTASQKGGYEGAVQADKASGHGVLIRADGSEVFCFYTNDVCGAQATIVVKGSVQYDGDVINLFATGFGVARFTSGERHEGEFSNNQRHGLGVMTAKDGTKTHGRWERDQYKGPD